MRTEGLLFNELLAAIVTELSEKVRGMLTKLEVQKIIHKIAIAYHAIYGNNIEKIILYGSYARGDHDDESDIDIVAIVHGKRADLQKKLKEIWDISSDLELEYGVIISPTVIPYDEYLKFKDTLPYYYNISKEGVNIVA